MPVTFGTVEVIPQPASATPASSGGTAASTAPPAIDARDLAAALRHLEHREARVRAH